MQVNVNSENTIIRYKFNPWQKYKMLIKFYKFYDIFQKIK